MKKYKVIFYDEDGTTVLDSQEVDEGGKTEYHGIKEKDVDGIHYTLVGFDNEEMLEHVNEDIKLVAHFDVVKDQLSEITEDEKAFYEATLESAKQTSYSKTIISGIKFAKQSVVLRSNRDAWGKIVEDIKKNGFVEISDGKENKRSDDEISL